MRMEEFIARANVLNSLIRVNPMIFTGMGLAGGYAANISMTANSAGTRANRAGFTVMTLDEKYKEVDALIEQCNGLIKNYRQVYDVVAETAAPEADEKAEIDAQIKEYRNQCIDIQGELDRLAREIAFYDQKTAECDQNAARLREIAHEIDKRNKSGNYCIPFYGIKYAVDTKNMYNDYRRKADQNNVLKEWLKENSARYLSSGSQKRELQCKEAELTKEMEKLVKRFGDVIELLNILNHMLASLGDFIAAAGKGRNALQYSFFENINEAQTAIDRTLSMIRNFYDAFKVKLEENSGKLEKDTYNRILELMGR